MIIPIYFAQDYTSEADLFMQNYDLIKDITMPERKPTKLKLDKELVCRFCKRKKPDVTFSKDAHIIPELLGNRHLVSDFECDSCNLKFGTTYEDHFAKFLGISRTLEKVRGKDKVPTFKSSDNKLRAEKESFFGLQDSIVLSNTDAQSNAVNFDPLTGAGSIEVIKQPYRPLWAYKALLKMALSCLDNSEMANYESALQFLLTEKLDQVLGKICNCRAYLMPVGYGIKDPFVLLFKKRQTTLRMPTHLFALFFKNSVYEIFLPVNLNDQKLYNGEPVSVYWCPPMFANLEDAQNVQVRYNDFDLSSSDLFANDKETIQFQADPEALKDLVRIDPLTGKVSPVDGNVHGTKKIILTPPGSHIDTSQFGRQ